jgi:hypothetical protein
VIGVDAGGAPQEAAPGSPNVDFGRLGELLSSGEIELETFRIAVDLVGQAKRLFHDVRKIANILAQV